MPLAITAPRGVRVVRVRSLCVERNLCGASRPEVEALSAQRFMPQIISMILII